MSHSPSPPTPTPSSTSLLPGGSTDPCVHCGFCLPTCASYRVLGTEMDSPRGRIHALKAINAGELKLDATVVGHFDSCLGCFACVSACPSGVRYDQLIEATRPQLNQPELRSSWQTSFRQLLLAVLPYPRRLRALLAPMRAYAGTPLQTFVRRSGLLRLLGRQLQAMEALLPPLAPEGFADRFPLLNPASGERRGRVGLVLGCVQRCFDPQVNAATVAVLQANGFDVVIPADQGCCGAVSHHQGQLGQTRELAKALINSFRSAHEQTPLDAVLVAASGCGHTLKAYGELVGNTTDRMPCQVQDVHEFLADRGFSKNFQSSLQPLCHHDGKRASENRPLVVAYHDACHMIHGQGITAQPRSLLKCIPHLQLREATEAGVCCGSAGIYNLVQPDEADALGQIKVDDLVKTGATVIASANIGCSLQLRRHIKEKKLDHIVRHPMELLSEAAQIN